ncbi:hypothetical protein NDA11_005728 [Ustilago hordei]|nr:hypothetical protein NDA11_005728 [Ustilago hordei]
MGSYGRSTGIEDLVDTSREHGRSAVSMETMDSYGLTCKGGPSTAMRRTKLKEQAQPRRGPSSRSMQMVTTQGLERQEPKELSLIKGGGAVSKESTSGHEEEEQCRRSRHQVMRRRSSVEGVDTAQEAQGCQAGEAPEQYLMKKVLSGERAGAASLAMLRREGTFFIEYYGRGLYQCVSPLLSPASPAPEMRRASIISSLIGVTPLHPTDSAHPSPSSTS